MEIQQLILDEVREMRTDVNQRFDKLESKVDHVNTKCNANTKDVAVLHERSKRGRWALGIGGSILGIVLAVMAIFSSAGQP